VFASRSRLSFAARQLILRRASRRRNESVDELRPTGIDNSGCSGVFNRSDDLGAIPDWVHRWRIATSRHSLPELAVPRKLVETAHGPRL
jgi:hypothetical protein